VVALAGDGASALQAVVAHAPDVLVADALMPGRGVAELVRLVGQARPATRVLLLAREPAPPAHPGTTRAASASQLATACRAEAPSPASPAPAPAPARHDHHAELLLRSLSEREREILALLARGHSNRRIAEGAACR
jgi:DNA-binding NarL/FixJ family response regulator